MSHPKDALLLGELSRTQCPKVDVGLATGDDVGAVVGVKLHAEHRLVGVLDRQHAHKPAVSMMMFIDNCVNQVYVTTSGKRRRCNVVPPKTKTEIKEAKKL